jgi:hypothetical protein
MNRNLKPDNKNFIFLARSLNNLSFLYNKKVKPVATMAASKTK